MRSCNIKALQKKIINCCNNCDGKGLNELLDMLRKHPANDHDKWLLNQIRYFIKHIHSPSIRIRLVEAYPEIMREGTAKFRTSYARDLLRARMVDKALLIIEQVVKENPDDFIALNIYGNTLISKGDYLEACKAFEQALRYKKDCAAFCQYGKSLYKTGQTLTAISAYQDALDLEPSNYIALTGYAEILRETGDISQALNIFEKALSHKPDDIITLNGYARTLAECGRVERAIEHYERSIKLEPGNLVTLRSYAYSLSECDRHDQAVKCFELALKIDPDNHLFLTGYANVLAKCGRVEQAIKSFEHSIEVNPCEISPLTNYASFLVDQGNIELALTLLDKALLINEEHPVVLSQFAHLLARSGDIKRACWLFEKSLSINPGSVITLNSYADALIQNGQFTEAFNYLDRAQALDPQNPKILATYATALASSGDTELALQKFTQAYELDPRNILTLTNYGKALAQAERFQDALALFKEVIHIEPDDKFAPFLAANTLQILKRPTEALAMLEMLKLGNSDFDNFIRLNLGRLYYQVGCEKKGRQQFEQMIENYRNPDAARIRVAINLMSTKPYSEEANRILKEITEGSPSYQQARRMLSLNLDGKSHYEMFGGNSSNSIQERVSVNRALYHNIKNRIAVLKETLYEKVIDCKDPALNDLLGQIDVIVYGIKERRAKETSKTEQLQDADYETMLRVISETSHDIIDFVGNKVSTIREKIWEQIVDLAQTDPRQILYQDLSRQLQRTLAALNDLKAVNQGIQFKYTTVAIKDLFENWLAISSLRKAHIKVIIDQPQTKIITDLQKVRGFLDELVENSLKHNPNITNLTIELRGSLENGLPLQRNGTRFQLPGQNHYLHICVCDNGQGIAADKKEWIFQPLTTTAAGDEGSGLGLFGIRRTLVEMNGIIEETGKNGARFEIYIPLEDK